MYKTITILFLTNLALVAVCILLNRMRTANLKKSCGDAFLASRYNSMMKSTIELREFTQLIPIECLREISRVLEHGAKKYSPDGWKIVDIDTEKFGSEEDFYSYKAQGHINHWINARNSNEFNPNYEARVKEKESGCHHLAHAVVNLMFAHWHDIKESK
jgi:hypothetical protein